MPVSNFSWSISSQDQLPPYSVFGRKRKISCSGDENQDIEDSQDNAAHKRQCVGQDAHCSGDAMNEMLEVNHNVANSANLNFPSIHNQTQGIYVPLPSQGHPHTPQLQCLDTQSQPQQTFTQQTVCHSETDMIMDLNDETYSTAQIDMHQEDLACCSMDSDCVPNPQQYQQASCDDKLLGGEISPISGRVRCFCRPSWDGLTDIRPYVSDYY